MDIVELTVKIAFKYPKYSELPTKHGKYYVITKTGDHKIMTYHPEERGIPTQVDHPTKKRWEGDWGEHSWMTNDDIVCWTETIPYISIDV